MRRLVVGILLTSVLSWPAASPAAAATGVTATLHPAQTSTAAGRHFTIRAQVSNIGAAHSGRLLAHLNVLSLQESVYVDPEDWSSDRTRQLASLPPGRSTTLTWSVQAVNTGRFAVYFVVVPDGPLAPGVGPLVVSSPTHVVVAARRTLNPGGSLAVIVIMPVLIGAAALAIRWRLRGEA